MTVNNSRNDNDIKYLRSVFICQESFSGTFYIKQNQNKGLLLI